MTDLHRHLRVVSDTASREFRQSAARLAGGDDGGSGGMEARVAKLEADVGHLTTDMRDARDTLRETSHNIADVRERISALEVKVDHLPSKDFVVKAFLGGFAAFVALSGFFTLFQGQIQHFFGVAR